MHLKPKPEISEDMIEEMARQMILFGRGTPNMKVFKGEPRMFGTPEGPVFALPSEEPVEIWTLYTNSARYALGMARTIVRIEDAKAAEEEKVA